MLDETQNGLEALDQQHADNSQNCVQENNGVTKEELPDKEEFISKITSELGSSYLASLEARHLWYYFEKCNSAKSDEEKRRARDKFFIVLRQSLERMALRRELRR